MALASLEIFAQERVLERVQALQPEWQRNLESVFSPHLVRVCGMIAGIELRQPDGSAFPSERKIGAAVCLAARAHGLLTRPIRDTVVLMPPLSSTREELLFAIDALRRAVADVLSC